MIKTRCKACTHFN